MKHSPKTGFRIGMFVRVCEDAEVVIDGYRVESSERGRIVGQDGDYYQVNFGGSIVGFVYCEDMISA